MAREESFFEIPYYHDFIAPKLARFLLSQATPLAHDLFQVGKGGGLETPEALGFLVDLYHQAKADLGAVLSQRTKDREFLDVRVGACSQYNDQFEHSISSSDYRTVVGLKDSAGRTVMGPLGDHYCRTGGKPVAPIPEFLQGPHVTLFGPPDNAKMAINAMNAYHRKLPGEPAVVQTLLDTLSASPMWGADDEDSKTPLRADLVSAGENLTKCFDGSIYLDEKYQLATDHLALPIKRFPGLALPSTFLFIGDSPVPLHLYDFALHLYHNWHNPKALVFYVPKLENEEEASYIHKMVSCAETQIQTLHPEYKLGTVRLMVVLENPRAILRTHEIMDALHPYFVGASLGWHDFLASTARVFKDDSHYRIPVKADPDIVIKYIKASHLLLADVVGSRGGIKVGGMYGILPIDTNIQSPSFQVTLQGYFKDVIIQLKRDLTGFWVAHPDFVRLGLAIVAGWKQHQAGQSENLLKLVDELLIDPYRGEVRDYLLSQDIGGLDTSAPSYVRSLIVADIEESDFIANNHPDEIRYNVFQSLQYLTDWLTGNGCVALPATINNVAVRVMDDLATAERSRWEVWHEVHHGRFKVEQLVKIAHEELQFIRKDLSNDQKIVQIKWDSNTEKWYPVALQVMLKLMTDPKPVEFASELLMPFTVESIRNAEDPLAEFKQIEPSQYALSRYVSRLNRYFEACGSVRFATQMAQNPILDLSKAQSMIESFSKEEIIEAASFHGDIGQSKKTLDATAAGEQSLVKESDTAELGKLGQKYLAHFGFKFLVSAKGKSSQEMLGILRRRLGQSEAEELVEARHALWEITRKRLGAETVLEELDASLRRHAVPSAQIAILEDSSIQTFQLGNQRDEYQIASLSKTVGTAFAMQLFAQKGINLETPVNALLTQYGSEFQVQSPKHPDWAGKVTIEHLLSHTALNLHYVNGFKTLPPVGELIKGKHGYEKIEIVHEPGTQFQYSGGGFLVLEYLVEQLQAKPALDSFLESFQIRSPEGNQQTGLSFPLLAAGMLSGAGGMARFLRAMTTAYQQVEGSDGISHDTAVKMLNGSDKGSMAFMGAKMGLGVFVAEAGANRLMIHQGANDGYRALFIHCFAGTDRGKGMVALCDADDSGVLFNAYVAQVLLRELEIEGIDWNKFVSTFDASAAAQEQIVNLGYKAMVFDAFEPDRPEAIEDKGNLDPLASCNLLVGSKVISVTNEKFARADNLISAYEPTFNPALFGRQGKVMDSWESARHSPEKEALVVELSKASPIQYVRICTKFHDGNHPEYFRLLGWKDQWQEIVPKIKLLGHSQLRLDLGISVGPFKRIKIEVYPDGGLTRVGLYATVPTDQQTNFKSLKAAEPERYPEPIPHVSSPMAIPGAVDGKVVSVSNQHYGPASQLLSGFAPIHMFDGFESARSREPGHSEQVVLELAETKKVKAIELDFKYFVNNNPQRVGIEAELSGEWESLVAPTNVKAFAGNQIRFELERSVQIQRLRVTLWPDGGINRIRLY